MGEGRPGLFKFGARNSFSKRRLKKLHEFDEMDREGDQKKIRVSRGMTFSQREKGKNRKGGVKKGGGRKRDLALAP